MQYCGICPAHFESLAYCTYNYEALAFVLASTGTTMEGFEGLGRNDRTSAFCKCRNYARVDEEPVWAAWQAPASSPKWVVYEHSTELLATWRECWGKNLWGLAREMGQHVSSNPPIHLFSEYLLNIFICQTVLGSRL